MAVNKAPTPGDLAAGNNVTSLPPSAILFADYIGDGFNTGLVTVVDDSLSAFGVGLPVAVEPVEPPPPPLFGEGGDGTCFITSASQGVSSALLAGLLSLVGLGFLGVGVFLVRRKRG
jgi:hypothetical protein